MTTTVAVTTSSATLPAADPSSTLPTTSASSSLAHSLGSRTICLPQVVVSWTAIKVPSSINTPYIIRIPTSHSTFDVKPSLNNPNLIISIVDAGYRSESYVASVFRSLSLAEEVIGTTSPFIPSDSEFCGWLPDDVSACLAGGWSSGTFDIPSDVRSVKIATAYTSRYTGRGASR